jgi:hypothetical protein
MFPHSNDNYRLRAPSRGATLVGVGFPQKLRQLGDIAGDPSRLILAEQFGCQR